MFLFLIWNLVKHETAAFFSMLFRQGLLLFFSPRKRSWFQVSPWLTEIWKCLRFSGTSGTGTSCDLRFNKWFWSIRWVCLHNLTSVFLIARWFFYLTVCSLREEGTARYGEKNLFAAQSAGLFYLNTSEGKSNKWIRSPSIYFDIPQCGLKSSPKLLSVISL